MEAEAAAATPAAPIPVETVYRTLEAALSFDNATRSAAERQLRDWEGDAAPGFIGSLLKVVAEVAAVPEVRGWVKPLGSTCEGIHVAWAACLMQGASWRLSPLAEHDAFLLPTCIHACRLTCPPHTGGSAHGGGGGQECGGVQLAQNHRQPRVVTRARWGLQAGEADAKLTVACHGSRQGRVAWHAISMAWRDPGMSYLLLMPWCAHGTRIVLPAMLFGDPALQSFCHAKTTHPMPSMPCQEQPLGHATHGRRTAPHSPALHCMSHLSIVPLLCSHPACCR